MPIYEYRCRGCHYQFDKLQKIKDEPLKICPQCHAETLTKLVSAAGFQLKGTGWYVTDFRDGGRSTSSKATSDGEQKGGDGSTTEGSGPEKAANPPPAEPSAQASA